MNFFRNFFNSTNFSTENRNCPCLPTQNPTYQLIEDNVVIQEGPLTKDLEICLSPKKNYLFKQSFPFSGEYNLIISSQKEKINSLLSISGTHTFLDDNNADHLRPNYITINLCQNDLSIRQLLINTSNAVEEFSFTELPKYDPTGKEYSYTIDIPPITGYKRVIIGNTITDTLEKLSVCVLFQDSYTKELLSEETYQVPYGSDLTILAHTISGYELTSKSIINFYNLQENSEHIFEYKKTE